MSDQRLFSCVTCGILCFACVAFLQPIEQAAQKPAVAYPCKRDSSSSLSPCPASYHLFSCYMFLFSFCQLQPMSKDTGPALPRHSPCTALSPCINTTLYLFFSSLVLNQKIDFLSEGFSTNQGKIDMLQGSVFKKRRREQTRGLPKVNNEKGKGEKRQERGLKN